ncbi:hypothetical protein WOLCODRAFT_137011 [Wolfiporia cocos MD-104 SS10]|uniref:RING-type domain-containing protein n=1 Tax=Wolfiporia cocos (strain MD-104) TaxID=742152 RepID=A0A2H3JSQ7_WOLCO|nr:hypothetical protein WOLCODRAFT_137011 [Wolfiporia cocos MD-104 SS10]
MPPRTRSHGNADTAVHSPQNGSESSDSEGDKSEDQLEVHLTRALRGAEKARKELEALRKRNAELERRLATIEEAEGASVQPKRGRKGGPTVAKLQGEIRKLNNKLITLEKAKQKDRKKIEKLRLKEVKADAQDLEEAAEFEVGDSAYRMRKLLRRFHDIIVSSSIEENEECPICLETVQVNKCASLICEHTFCETCLSQISPESEIVTCPQCRKPCPRDEIETVQYTASQQWDALLEVAQAWAKMDLRRQEDTSEEEAEEEFIDDEPPDDVAASASRSASENPLASSPEPQEPHAGSSHVDMDLLDAPATMPNKKRRVAVSPESSPLSHVSSTNNDPQNTTEPHNSRDQLPNSDISLDNVSQKDEEAVAGPSNAPVPGTPPPAQASTPTTPSYSQSPVADRRKRLQELAAARKRKRG